MAIDGLHHLVLRVPNLGDAERFYRELFDLDVLFREGQLGNEYGALPDSFDWSDAPEKGVEPGMSFLGRDAFALALVESESEAGEDAEWREGDTEIEGRLDHVALALDPADCDAICDRADELDCEYEAKGNAVFVTDRYGVEWELNASSPPPETPFETLDV